MRLGSARRRCRRRPAVPPIPAPPARVYTPRPERERVRGPGGAGTRPRWSGSATSARATRPTSCSSSRPSSRSRTPRSAPSCPTAGPRQHGFVGVRSRVTSHREFLLRPDLGRRLDDASLATVRSRCDEGHRRPGDRRRRAVGGRVHADRQGAARRGGRAACAARGLRVGTPIAARFARVWLEDEIGQEVGAKVAMILLGERPGLGTGDGLSALRRVRARGSATPTATAT